MNGNEGLFVVRFLSPWFPFCYLRRLMVLVVNFFKDPRKDSRWRELEANVEELL